MRTSSDTSVAIVADDLTGANDSVAQFADVGWRARLTLAGPPPRADGRSWAIGFVTDSRSQDGASARAGTASAVTAVHEAGFGRLFVKIDSTMRGPVAEQIAGAMGAWSEHHPDAVAVVCPAYPTMGRTVLDGHVLVNGARAETTAAGRDPVTPITTSDIAHLVPGGVLVRLGPGGSSEHAAQIEAARADGAHAVIVDAGTADDLQAIAAALARLAGRAVPVGAAGLARAVAKAWARPGQARPDRSLELPTPVERALVVISSLHDVSRDQYQALIASTTATRVLAIKPSLETALDPGSARRWIGAVLAARRELPPVVVVAAPPRCPAVGASSRRGSAGAILLSLAEITEAVFDRRAVGALVLIGGDGARVVLDRLGATAIHITGTLREGVPLGRVEGGRAHGLYAVTKAGGFGHDRLVADVIGDLLGDHDHGART